MPEPSPSSPVVRFGLYEVDLRAGELRKNGLRVQLQDRPFEILAILLERPGQVVTREEFCQRLWPKDTFVDFDHSLNASINKLRQALHDEADNPRFIATAGRRGYRFIALMDAFHQAPAPVTATAPAATVVTEGPRRGVRLLLIALGAAVVLGILLGICELFLASRAAPKVEGPAATMLITPVTASGKAVDTAISPDGKYVVYALEEAGQQSLSVRQLATGSDVQIRSPAEVSYWGLTFLATATTSTMSRAPEAWVRGCSIRCPHWEEFREVWSQT